MMDVQKLLKQKKPLQGWLFIFQNFYPRLQCNNVITALGMSSNNVITKYNEELQILII
jgi:hypothetical protein